MWTVFSVLQIETEYGKGAWSGDVYRDVVSFPGDGKCHCDCINVTPTSLPGLPARMLHQI